MIVLTIKRGGFLAHTLSWCYADSNFETSSLQVPIDEIDFHSFMAVINITNGLELACLLHVNIFWLKGEINMVGESI